MTKHEAWLLSFCIRANRSMLRMASNGAWSLNRMRVQDRHGCEPDGIRLLREGWVTLRVDPAPKGSGETWPAHIAVITAKGRRELAKFHEDT